MENSEKNQQRAAFLEAMNTSTQEIETEFEEIAVQELTKALKQNGLLVLGEMHGVRENPSVIYILFKKFGFRVLALEWNRDLQPVIDHFLETGEFNFEALTNQTDGRITAGHFDLMKKLKEEGLLDKVLLIDDETQWKKRDEIMASTIVDSVNLERPMLVVAGNAHTRRDDIHESDGEVHHSMLHHIEDQSQPVPIAEIEYLSGSFYNNRVKSLGDDNVEERTARFYTNEKGIYVFELPKAHAAVVPNMNEVEEG